MHIGPSFLKKTDYYTILNGKDTSDEMIQAPMCLKYPKNHAFKHYQMPSEVKQGTYCLIETYVNKIKALTNILGGCLNMHDDLLKQKKEEVFYNGVASRTKCEMDKLNVKKCTE